MRREQGAVDTSLSRTEARLARLIAPTGDAPPRATAGAELTVDLAFLDEHAKARLERLFA